MRSWNQETTSMSIKPNPLISLLAVIWMVAPADPKAASVLEVRDLSQANLPGFGIAHEDDAAITTATDAEILQWLQGCSVKGFKDMAGYGQSDWVYRSGGVAAGGKIDAFESSWPSRALVAYMRARPQARSGQKDSIDQWFLENASFLAEHMRSFLGLNFPGRDTNNYSIRWRDAAKPGFYGLVTTQGGDSIPLLSQWYNNRRSLTHFHLLLASVAFKHTQPDSSRKFQSLVNRYIQEWVTYSVFPTGEVGEWARNHEYPNSFGEFIEAQGVSYNAYNSALALTAALVFEKKLADSSLRVFRTRGGLWGTECEPSDPEKSIWTASDLHLGLIGGLQTRVNREGARMQAVYNYTSDTAPYRAELMHASWYLPAHRYFRPAKDGLGNVRDSESQILETWLAARKDGVRADDPFGKWRGVSGTSKDIRTETFEGIVPFEAHSALARGGRAPSRVVITQIRQMLQVEADGLEAIEIRHPDGSLFLREPAANAKWSSVVPPGWWLIRTRLSSGTHTQRIWVGLP